MSYGITPGLGVKLVRFEKAPVWDRSCGGVSVLVEGKFPSKYAPIATALLRPWAMSVVV